MNHAKNVWGIKSFQISTFILVLVSQLMYSCTSNRTYRTSPGKGTYKTPPQKPQYSNSYREARIISRGQFSSVQMSRYFLSKNPRVKPESIDYIARLYIRECAVEGVNHDIAFAQMCHETNFLQYGNQVKSWQHNYCGLGATDNGARGLSFPDAATGIRVHVQHLKAYGGTWPMKNRIIDPRYKYVKRGSAPTIDHLAGTWASDPYYANRLRRHLSGMNGSHSL